MTGITWIKSEFADVWEGYVDDVVQFTISGSSEEEIQEEGRAPFIMDRRIGNFSFGNEVECETLDVCKVLAAKALESGNLVQVDMSSPMATKTTIASTRRTAL